MTQIQVGKPTRDDDIRWDRFPDEVPFHGYFRGLSNRLTQILHEIASCDGVTVSYDPDAQNIVLEFDASVDPPTVADCVARMVNVPDKVRYFEYEHLPGHCFRVKFLIYRI